MFERRIFALSLLSVLTFAGCVEGVANNSEAVCGNQIIEGTEVCDGTVIPEALKVCPTGTTLVNAGLFGCSGTCDAVITASACQANSTPGTKQPVCNDGVLDAGEDCDGAQFAAGKKVCPAGTTGNVENITCNSSCQVMTSEACKSENDAAYCGDGYVNAAGEDCEINVYGITNAAGAILNCDSFAGTGAQGALKCVDCKLDSSACLPANANPNCNNGTLDADEVCDGDKFADDAAEKCGPSSIAKDKLVCKDNCQLDIAASCETVVTNKCGNHSLDDGEACDGTLFPNNVSWTCPEGMEPTAKPACDNCEIYIPGSCQAKPTCGNGKIDGVEACDKKADGSVVVASSTKCPEGKILKGDNFVCTDKCEVDLAASCQEASACTENAVVCKGQTVQYCLDNMWQDYNVCPEGTVCDANAEDVDFCVPTTGCTATCVGSVYYVCDDDAWLSEDCSANGQICDDGCIDAPPCGNGIIDSGEKCDPLGNVLGWEAQQHLCNYYNEIYDQEYVLYKSGAPSCTNKCKVEVVNTCIKVTDEDFSQVKSWTFTSLDQIKGLTQGEVKIHNVGNKGFDSKYTNSAWYLGGWPTASNPNWDAYMIFDAGTVDDNAVRITFDAWRSKNGPKNLVIKAYSNGENESSLIGTSPVITLTQSKTAQKVQFRKKSSIGKLKFKVTAYGDDGGIYLQNVRVLQTEAL